MPTVVELPTGEAKAYMCSCGKYGSPEKPGNQYGVSTHRSKTKCGGVTQLILPDSVVPSTLAAEPEEPEPESEELIVEGKTAAGRVVEARGPGGPTMLQAPTKTSAALRATYDVFRARLGYTGEFGPWLEEMAQLALEACFGFELVAQMDPRKAAGAGG